MAFSTLAQIRNPGFDNELGIDPANDATDTSFGTTAVRNGYLQRAFAKLWPEMGRLIREDITTVSKQIDYSLASIVDLELVTVLDSAGLEGDRVKSWQLYVDESSATVVRRLLLPQMTGGLTVRCVGYAPYIVPASDSASCDLPPTLEYIVTAGGRVEAYRGKVNKFADFKNFQSENRSTAISAAELLDLMHAAAREFAAYRSDNRRNLTAAHRAQRQVR